MSTHTTREPGAGALTESAASVDTADAKSIAMAALTKVAADAAVPRLTAQDRDDLRRLEEVFVQGQRESIAALREIRERKLYREGYATFDEYMMCRWGHSRQWATQQINWLRRMELLEGTGNDRYQMTADDAKALGPLEDDPELFVAAIAEAEEEAKRAGKKRTKKYLQEAVKRRTDFLSARANLGVPDLSYEESRTLGRLGVARMSHPNLVEEAKVKAETEGHPLSDCLLEVCQSRHVVPMDKHLLAVARGKELEALVEPLTALRAKWDEIAELQEKRRKLEDELDKIDEQTAPPPDPAQPPENRATGPMPHDSAAVATEGGEEAEESDEDVGPAYQVLLTGDFEEIARGCLHQGGAEMEFDASSLPDLLALFAEKIGEGWSIGVESSITVVPLATDETDDDEDEEPEEDLDDEDEGDE
jgi:hypothetical protein